MIKSFENAAREIWQSALLFRRLLECNALGSLFRTESVNKLTIRVLRFKRGCPVLGDPGMP
jgi:hypothetical protein